jgi:hypothetical protein
MFDCEAQAIAAERLALGGQENGHLIGFDGDLRTGLANLLLKPRGGPL